MKTDINELITLNYELEGLLLLALHRGDDTPSVVWQMIDSHVKAIADGVAIELESLNKDDASQSVSDDNVELLDEPLTVESNEPESEVDSEFVVEPEARSIEVAPDVDPESDTISESESDVDENVDDSSSSGVDEDNASAVADSELDNDDEEDCHLTLDEKLARENSRCLKKAFSLNDRFRFRRELFGNSDAAITDALDLVEAMHSIDEAHEYFFEELEWNPENPEVKDFMDIITKHFLSR